MKRALPGVVAALAAALVGCGGSSKTVTVTAPATTGSSVSTSNSTTTATAAAPTSTAGGATTSAGPRLALPQFQSPSGNIGCIIAGGVARCDIKQRNWSPPPRPSSCPKQVDFGQGLEVSSSGAGRFVCAGDTALDPTAAKLAYGTSTGTGQITCTSAASGITCKNSGGGGFLISIQGYKVY